VLFSLAVLTIKMLAGDLYSIRSGYLPDDAKGDKVFVHSGILAGVLALFVGCCSRELTTGVEDSNVDLKERAVCHWTLWRSTSWVRHRNALVM
jgi:hypothetical protein